MPIDVTIEPSRRLVLAAGRDELTADELFSYQREVWTRPEVAGFDELMDMSGVTRIVEPSAEHIRSLVELSASMDTSAGSARFAIVAPADVAFGLARMYETYRGLHPRSTKAVSVFRTREEAMEWLAQPPRAPGGEGAGSATRDRAS